MTTDKQRKGSLAWRQNAKRGLRSMVAVVPKKHCYGYFIKVQTRSEIHDGFLQCCTILKEIPLEKVKPNLYKLKYSLLGVKRARKKDVLRQIDVESESESVKKLKQASYVDVLGVTKGKGTQGPVRVCGLSLGLRKTKRGFRRHPGAMGCRKPGRIFPTKPFAKKMGNAKRTILNLKVLDYRSVENFRAYRYFSKTGNYLVVKGSVPGTLGSTVAVRPALRMPIKQ